MNLKNFIKDKILLAVLLLFGITTIEIFLIPYTIANFIKIYIPITIVSIYLIEVSVEYFIKQNFYKGLENILNELDNKYLISEIIKEPNFMEGKILKDLLEQINKSMIENVNSYKYKQEDYKDYIELWIHEVKIPIATSKMIIENNKSQITKSIDEELQKIENYVEQALYYARSNVVEKDYYIKKVSLKDIVNESIRKNKNILIHEKISINIHNIEVEVNTDNKWIVFILNQIIENSVKYKRQDENLEIEIYAKQGKENVILYIKDNGIGIKEGEVTKVFEKGFTGTNGRLIGRKSTGIGLYLCKNLCNKLGVGIELNGVQEGGTQIQLIFPQSSYVDIRS
ncbi:MAG: HAMP domain-containing histidine kinase [Clostridia bacterium]|jgi:signal transduction histidine kinase|nr:HAMP domain-containing histidine kinase [Clostridia bacterium]